MIINAIFILIISIIILIIFNKEKQLDETEKLIQYLDSLCSNYKFKLLTSKRQVGSKMFHHSVVEFLNEKLNKSPFYIFKKIELLSHLYYYGSVNKRYVEIFKISTDVYSKKVYIGQLILAIDLLCIPTVSQNIEKIYKNIHSEYEYQIISIKLLGKNINQTYYDDLFIKSDEAESNKDSEDNNSLIPTVVGFSDDSDQL
jgi:hypothetical protein